MSPHPSGGRHNTNMPPFPEKGRRGIEEIVEEMKKRDRGESGQELSEDNAARRKGLIG